MKTMKSAKSVLAILIVCFTLAGTTSCKKEDKNAVATQKAIDPKLVGNWKTSNITINSSAIVDVTEETFKADGTGVERDFKSTGGVISDEKITTFEWSLKSEGILHVKTSNNEEGDVSYHFGNDANTKMELQLPSGQRITFGKIS